MKKILILLLLISVTLLTGCGAMDTEDVPSDTATYEDLYYRYDFGTYNNASHYSLLYGINDYQIEFDTMYKYVISRNDELSLSDTELEAYSSFFQKLETLDKHSTAIFRLESNDLKELFEENFIEITAYDIFTFLSLKEFYQKAELYQANISPKDFITLHLDTPFTDTEEAAIDYLFYFHQRHLDYENINNYEDTLTFINNHENITVTDDELAKLELGYQILDSIKNK